MGDMIERSDGAPMLSEPQLKHISRNIRNLIPDDAGSKVIKSVQDDFQAVCGAAISSNQNATFQVAAWNTLCAILERCSQHDDDDIRRAIHEKGWWTHAFNVYLTRAQFARPKSAKQLLTTLTTVSHRLGGDGDLSSVRDHACHSLVEPLANGGDYGQAKICALGLAHFLSKDVVSIDEVISQCRASSKHETKDTEPDDQTCLEAFLYKLFRWMGRADFGSIIGQTISNLLDKGAGLSPAPRDRGEGTNVPLWAAALQRATREDAIDVATLRAHVLPMLFKRSASDYHEFLISIGLRAMFEPSGSGNTLDNQSQSDLLCASLQAGKALDMLREITDGELHFADGILYIPLQRIAHLLQRASPTIRLTAMSVLITSRVATRPLSPAALSAIRRNLGHFFGDTDANFRSDVFGLVQRLVDRIRAITAVLARQTDKANVDAQSALKCHAEFLLWLLRFLQWELRPTASYQRHISALKCQLAIAQSGLDDAVAMESLSKSALGETKWPMHIRILTPDLRQLLLDRALDPFDDVRQLASATLALYRVDDSDNMAEVTSALGRAEHMMLSSGRANQADGVAHLYVLLYRQGGASESTMTELVTRLDQMLLVAQEDLGKAVGKYPVHGLLTSLRYIIEQDRRILDEVNGHLRQLSKSLTRLWEVVKPILCDDAPEGYMPEEAGDADLNSTKDTLSYCWRALKESSMLLASLLPSADANQANQLAALCFTQLAELRHRGAFSTVAQTWVACCIRTRDLLLDGQPSLHRWYARTRSILQNKTTINTRRSAGLPSLVCGILIAERDTQLLERTIVDLEIIARAPISSDAAQESSLPQVHAINCLKDILKNSRLGEASEQYIPLAMSLAADALRSPAWAIRNCGLMLFRSVIDRLLGTNEAHSEDDVREKERLTVEQHPQLLDVVLRLLCSSTVDPKAGGVTAMRNEGVFPALQLLQRQVVPAEHSTVALEAVQVLMADSSWHVRDKAARTYAFLVSSDQTSERLRAMLRTSTMNQNALHGALLCARYLWRRWSPVRHGLRIRPSSDSPLKLLDMSNAVSYMDELYRANGCPFTRAAYIDLLSSMIDDCKGYESADKSTLTTFSEFDLRWTVTELRVHGKAGGGAAMLRHSLVLLLATQFVSTPDIPAELRQAIHQQVRGLSEVDADAVATLLGKWRSILDGDHKLPERARHAIVDVCEQILKSNIVTGLHSSALGTLLRAMDDTKLEHPLLGREMLNCGSQRYMDAHLAYRAARLESAVCNGLPVPLQSSRAVQSWVDCCVAASEGATIYSREAAAFAVLRLDLTYSELLTNESLQSTMLALCIVVYDLLNDDNEDIRISASTAASRILQNASPSRSRTDQVPAVAAQRLLSFMVQRWPSNSTFVDRAMFRSFGDLKSSISTRLRAATISDTALFIEEKQNLYIDDAREAKTWSQAPMQLPRTVVTRSAVKKLSFWVAEGLDELAARRRLERQGPLGWTSQPESFTLGLQVIYGAEYLLHLSDAGYHLPVRPSALRYQLAEMLYTQGSARCHLLWRREVERVLAVSVAKLVVSVHAVLRHQIK